MSKTTTIKSLKKKKHERASESVFLWVFFVIFCIYGLSLFFPVGWAFINSLKTSDAFYENSFAFPQFAAMQWKNYKNAFTDITFNSTNFIGMTFNSLWMTSLCVLVNVACSTLTAYALAKYRFPCRGLIYSIAIIVQVIPIIGTGGARYKFMYNIGMINNPLTIWVSWAGGFDFAFIVLFGYFKSISGFYAEAASIDGASEWTVMTRVMLPQALPAIGSLLIINFISTWNDYTMPLIYMRNYPTLALGIYSFRTSSTFSSNATPTYFAAILLSMLPVLILFCFTQKQIMTNVTAGGLKG